MDKKKISKEIGKAILLTVGLSGILILAVTSPGIGIIFKEIQKKKFQKYQQFRLNQAFKRLEKQKLILIKEEGDKVRIELSEKGKKKVLMYNLDEMKLKQDKWDKIWRIVIFDIPEEKKNARDFLRLKMKELGFYLLQRSVLVTPWDCRKEIDFIKHFYEVDKYVNLIEAKCFGGDEQIKRYFRI